MAPSMALMGKNLVLPGFAALQLQIPDIDGNTTPATRNEATMDARLAALADLECTVLQNVAQAQAIQSAKFARTHARKRDRNEHLMPDIGDYVLIREHKDGKLMPTWEAGIYRVTAFNADRTVATITGDGDSPTWEEHIQHIKLYHDS